jgi:predicted porin
MSLIACATCAGTAAAQSSVTIFGTVDLNGRYVKNDGSDRRLSMSQDGVNQSQLGFRGSEDLGGGLRAGFTLVSTINADTGSANAKFFNRRSTVSLLGNDWGELRLGRDYVPTFWNNVLFDAFGGTGIGNSFDVWQLQTTYAGSPAFGNFVRSDNAIGYFLPSGLGGVYGQAMVGASEGASNQGRLIGARIGYAAGALDIAFAAGQQRFDVASNPAITGVTAGSSQKTYNLGVSYDFKVAKLLGYVVRDTREGLKEARASIGASIPFGASEVHLGYARSKLTNDLAANTNTVSRIAASYQYNLSTRTAVYATVAQLSNGDHPLAGVTQSVAGWNAAFAGTTQTAQPVAGGKSKGAEFGLRHLF